MNLKELPDRPKKRLLADAVAPTLPGGWHQTILVDEDGGRYVKKHRLRTGRRPCYEAAFFQIMD